ncbi:MAG TPA: hypothetical protein VHZ51_19035 [Ktedonobacteraceae bacterium]|nr:hypothetical protein [Ktedonobacteraceae bacterium]
MQQHERLAFEPERASDWQGARDRWSEGEKLQAEPKHTIRMGRGLRPATIIFLIVALFVFFFLLGSVAFVHVSREAFPGEGPGPIPHSISAFPGERPGPIFHGISAFPGGGPEIHHRIPIFRH